ncbi:MULTISPECIES: hypothetical protein [Streptomyces]|uniref:hypothetical protein n=1 Tax=Streptomyces TaxID=1883 RepID=UPI0002F95486|nr:MULTISPECIES: hypothetical protein [Streptomyces]MYS62993.1 hypothetical protein [Streptomyces sp. SID5473]
MSRALLPSEREPRCGPRTRPGGTARHRGCAVTTALTPPPYHPRTLRTPHIKEIA